MTMAAGLEVLRRAIHSEFECEISRDKAPLLASPAKLAVKLRAILGRDAGPPSPHGVVLGIDHSAGNPRAFRARATKRAERHRDGNNATTIRVPFEVHGQTTRRRGG